MTPGSEPDSEEYLKAVLDASLDAIVTMDHEGRILEFNSAAERTFGHPRTEVIGRPLAEVIVPPALRARHNEGLRRYLATGEARVLGRRIELPAVRRDGSVFPAEVVVARIRSRGNPRFTGFIRDITEQKKAQETEERLRLAQQVAHIGAFEWNVQTQVNTWSPQLEAMYGLRPGEFGKKQANWEQLIHPDDRAAAVARVEEAFRSTGPVEGEWRTVWPDGSVHWLIGRFQLLKDEAGNPHRLVGVNLDITDRKNAEEATARAQEDLRRAHELLADRAAHLESVVAERTQKLQEMVEELEGFSYSVSHDLRAPLRAMKSFAQILDRETGPALAPEARDHLRRISEAAERMDRLIQDLLSYSRVVNADLPLAAIDLDSLLRGVVESYPGLQPSAAEVRLDGPFPKVRGNESALLQVFSNLLGNAVKFVAPGVRPRVRVFAESSGDRVTLHVRDNGIGIQPEHHAEIFGIFKRLHRSYEGTGIGLTIVKKAVARMGGSIAVVSEPGSGSTFSVTLDRGETSPP